MADSQPASQPANQPTNQPTNWTQWRILACHTPSAMTSWQPIFFTKVKIGEPHTFVVTIHQSAPNRILNFKSFSGVIPRTAVHWSYASRPPGREEKGRDRKVSERRRVDFAPLAKFWLRHWLHAIATLIEIVNIYSIIRRLTILSEGYNSERVKNVAWIMRRKSR